MCISTALDQRSPGGLLACYHTTSSTTPPPHLLYHTASSSYLLHHTASSTTPPPHLLYYTASSSYPLYHAASCLLPSTSYLLLIQRLLLLLLPPLTPPPPLISSNTPPPPLISSNTPPDRNAATARPSMVLGTRNPKSSISVKDNDTRALAAAMTCRRLHLRPDLLARASKLMYRTKGPIRVSRYARYEYRYQLVAI